jgi:hopanoid biosynthesis associated RND transporter like protein HpnN
VPEVAQVATVSSFVPDDQEAKLAIIGDASLLLGPTLSPPSVKPPPDDAAITAAIRECIGRLREAAAASGGDAGIATRLRTQLEQAVARGPAILPSLAATIVGGLDERLQSLRLALDAQPVSLETLPEELKRAWVAPDGRTRIEVFPKGDARDNRVLRRFVAAVRAVAPEATGTPVSIQESGATVVAAFTRAGIIALVAITLLLVLVLRNLHDVALVLAPLLLGALLTVATSVTIGLPLNFANIIALPLLLGIGVAFDIYFVMNWRAGHGLPLQSATARAVIFSALVTTCAFGSLALSSHPGTSEMGKLLTISLAYTLLSTLLLLPALLGPPRR